MVLADFQVNGMFPSKVATSGTAAVYFPRTFGSQFNVTPSTPTAANATGQLLIPGSQYFNAVNGQRLRVVASGSVFTAASQTVTVTVQVNTGTAASPTYNTLMATAATTVNGRAAWNLETHCAIAGNASLAADLGTGLQLNSGSPAPFVQGQLSGEYFGSINGVLVDLAVVTPIPVVTIAGVPYNTSGLVVNVAFGTGTAGNNATLNEFVILGD